MDDPEGARKVMKPVQARKTKLAVMGISSAVLDEGDPRYAQCVRLANGYRKARMREMAVEHGFVSSGVAALLASASLALAGSRFLYVLAAVAEGNTAGLIKTAASIGDSARQNELAAWDLCHKEAILRGKHDAARIQVPWLIEAQGPSVTANPSRGRGRPRKLETSMSVVGNIPTEGDSNA